MMFSAPDERWPQPFLAQADWSEFLYRKSRVVKLGTDLKTRTFPWRGNGEHLLKG
jgi:hypothetical protein